MYTSNRQICSREPHERAASPPDSFFDGYAAGRWLAALYPDHAAAYLRGIRYALRDARDRDSATQNAALREVAR
jgi:hypothetical protein